MTKGKNESMSYSFKSVENNGGLMAQGDYEVYVKSCGVTTTKSGNECISFDFVVRSDVNQPYQNKHIFKKFYPSRDTGEYPSEKIGKYANALGIEKGQEFDLGDLVGLSCIIHISHFTTDDGVTRECIFYTAPSKVDPYMGEAPNDDLPEIDDDDKQLPF